MSDKKQHTYQSNVLALPPLKMVLGEVPEPDPSDRRRTMRTFGSDKNEAEARITVTKIIGHLKKEK